MPNVKRGELCQVRCPKHTEANGHWVIAEHPAIPGEKIRVENIVLTCDKFQWVCSSRGGIPMVVDDNTSVVGKIVPLCDGCLYPNRPDAGGMEDSELRGLPKPVTDMRDLVTKDLPPARRERKLTPA